MLSKHVTKIIQNLEKKKYRDKYHLFKVEGEKLVLELLRAPFSIDSIFAYPQWIEKNTNILATHNVTEITESEMSQISNFQSLPEVVATVQIPEYTFPSDIYGRLSIVLNGIQDPGNIGTILRVSDWFGIKYVFCDSDCANIYNWKCIQASMGAIFRIKVFYLDLPKLLSTFPADEMPRYGTFLNGENIYKTSLVNKGFIIMGNEGNGIRPDIESLVNCKLTIPSFAHNEFSTESLNVGVATGIILSEFMRNS